MTISIDRDTEGQPEIVWKMTPDMADSLMTLLARVNLDQDIESATRADVLAHLNPLYEAVSAAFDLTGTAAVGCPDLWPDAPTMNLDEAAFLGTTDGDTLGVLIPGQTDPLTAIMTAVDTVRAYGFEIDPHDPNLIGEVGPARWVLLHKCESTSHDFHPSLAPHGPQSDGAILATFVTLAVVTG